MNGPIQEVLSSLELRPTDSLWAHAPNAWVRVLSRAELGKVGERLAQAVLGGVIETNNRAGYDLVVGSMCVEVKLATLSMMNGYPVLAWMNIRPSDPYTHICFIAVYPDDTRMFLVPRDSIPSTAFNRAYSRGERSSEIYQLHTRRTKELIPWLVSHEIKEAAENPIKPPPAQLDSALGRS